MMHRSDDWQIACICCRVQLNWLTGAPDSCCPLVQYYQTEQRNALGRRTVQPHAIAISVACQRAARRIAVTRAERGTAANGKLSLLSYPSRPPGMMSSTIPRIPLLSLGSSLIRQSIPWGRSAGHYPFADLRHLRRTAMPSLETNHCKAILAVWASSYDMLHTLREDNCIS